MKKVYTIIISLFWLVSLSSAQKAIRIDYNHINKIVESFKDSLNIPGMAVGIAVGDEVKYTNVSGYSDLKSKERLKINSTWHICSISKQFSTVSCLKLAEENKLSLQDKISKYTGQLPEAYSNITVFDILSQTSGIKDYLNEKNLYGYSWKEVEEQVFADTLNFKSGTSWSYSNTGFWIAARIIEKITGMDYDHYLDKNIFNKLKMGQTQRISGEKVTESRVNGYVSSDKGLIGPTDDIKKFQGKGDGDLISTLNDLLKWNIALTHGKVIKKESLAELWTPTKLIDGKTLEIFPNSGINYGIGWFIKSIDGEKIVWTPGSGFGFSTTSQYIPGYDLTIIVFCNKEQFLMADEVGFSIASYILNEMHR